MTTISVPSLSLTDGMKSSEFWVAIATAIASYAGLGLPPEVIYTLISYILSRGIAKRAAK